MPLLDIASLSVSFKTRNGAFRAVDSINLQVDANEVLAIVGESGSGKSVAMLAVMGLLPWTATVTADRMSFDGQDLRTLSPAQRRKIGRKRHGDDLPGAGVLASIPCFTVGFQIKRNAAPSQRICSIATKAAQKTRSLELLAHGGHLRARAAG